MSKKKFNIIDIAVVLLIITAVVGFSMRFSGGKKSLNSQTEFRYTIQVENVRNFTVDALKKSLIVTDEDSLISIGEIKDVQVKNAIKANYLNDGTLVSPTLPEKYTCLVTIEARGSESDNKFLLEDTTELAVGRTTDLITKYVSTSGVITSVEVIE